MIGRLRQPLQDLSLATRIDGRARYDLLKQRRIDVSRARECREQAARSNELHPEQIDVFVAAAAALELIDRMNELGRVENHEVEPLARFLETAQFRRNVAVEIAAAIRDAIEPGLALGQREGLARCAGTI